ncbi:MAG: hypothetical protein PHO54_03255 [Candidatus Peribacteraceae bacterium]|nr:hypothetical protein [Candidatus Peribacteraceae bacterium]
MAHRGFTAVETLLTLGIIAVTAGVTIPLYRNYQVRSDLDIATEYTVQGLHRAQVLSQSGQNNAVWGFSAREGVLFQGETYSIREASFDEVFPLPSSVSVSGLLEVTFRRVSGIPNQTGEIILEALNGERRIITVSADGLLGLSEIIPPEVGIPGASSSSGTTGSEGSGSSGAEQSSSASGGTTSEGGSSAGGGDSSDGTGGGGTGSSSSTSSEPTCDDQFTVENDGTIQTTGTVNATVKVLGSEVAANIGGSAVNVRVSASTDNGQTWVSLFGGNTVVGGEQEVLRNLPSGTKLLFKVNGRHSWLFNRTFQSNDSAGHMLVLRNGGALPEFDAFTNHASLSNFLRGVLDANGRIKIGRHDALFLTELDTLWRTSADFQDVVIQSSFAAEPGSCAESSDPKFKVIFDRLENQGNGNVGHRIYVGGQAVAYAEGQWIPLQVAGTDITDGGMTADVPGLAAERQLGAIRILSFGSHPMLSGKEIVDARIVFDHALVEEVVNGSGENATESPFDSIVNDGSGGDEITVASDKSSVIFQTRVTGQNDAILVRWKEGQASSSSSSSAASSQGSTGSSGSAGSTSSDTSASVSSSTSGQTSSDGGAASGGTTSDGMGPADPCAALYTLDNKGRIVLGEKTDVTFQILGSSVTYGANGPEIRVRFNTSFDGGATWKSLFRFRDIMAGDMETFTDVPSGSVIGLSAEGRYSWLFKRVARSGDGDGRLRILRPGEAVPAMGLLRSPGHLKQFLRDVLSEGKVKLGRKQLLVLTELQDFNDNTDYQDAVVVVTLEKPASEGICGAATGDTDDGSGDSGSAASGASSSFSAGQLITICHYPSGNQKNPQTLEIDASSWPAHSAHGDRQGACGADQDGDGVANADDLCPGTYTPESVPTETMLFKRFALTESGNIFREGPRKKVSQYTLADARGCSCEQLVDVAEGKRSYNFVQFPSLERQMRSLFPFYTSGARQFGCGSAILNMIKQ